MLTCVTIYLLSFLLTLDLGCFQVEAIAIILMYLYFVTYQHEFLWNKLTHYDPWAKYGPSLVFVKFYRNIAMPVCLDIVYGCFFATNAEPISCNRDHRPAKLSIFTIWPFSLKVCRPCLRAYAYEGLCSYKVCILLVLLDTTFFSPAKLSI